MNSAAHIAIVDDEPDITALLANYLQSQGYRVTALHNGRALMALMTVDAPALVLLDLGLPGEDGFSIARQLREHWRCGLVIVTGRGDAVDKVVGLEVGADDYVTKPFSPRELVLRIRSVLRRASGSVAPHHLPVLLRDGDLVADTGRRVAHLGERQLSLTVREFDLLAFLLANPARAFTRAELLDKVWGWRIGDQSTVTVHVRRLREKIEPDPAVPTRIHTVWGVGYRYEPATRDDDA